MNKIKSLFVVVMILIVAAAVMVIGIPDGPEVIVTDMTEVQDTRNNVSWSAFHSVAHAAGTT